MVLFVEEFYDNVIRLEIFKLADLDLELFFGNIANLWSRNYNHSNLLICRQVLFEYCSFKGLDRESVLRFIEKAVSTFDEKEREVFLSVFKENMES